ncbi:MAG: TonB-dependent receptor [Acidobacteria bacterium]|nr:TonB-dependent receptor [Acidobacteriota bacterium]
MIPNIRFRTVCALAAFAIWATPLMAQTFQAQITGVVQDPTGAVIPNAKITATNVATGVVFSTESNALGIYRLPALPPAQYRLTATTIGFKSFEQGPITLQVNDVVEIQITLQVGDASEKVQVSASAELLQTATATVGQVVNTRAIENLPLNVRDPLALVGLTAGVTFGGNFGNGGGQELGRNFFKSDFNVGGGRSGSQELLLDGAANTTPDVNRGIINPPVDSVQEFKVQSNSYDAEFGRTTGGIVNVITKSGTNEIHGLAYDFERHSFIEANNWFSNRAGIPNPSFKRHQFGGNLGLPIVKNKTFFFGDYEGLRQGFPVTFTTTVPTEAMRTGNFTGLTNITIYDPTTLVTNADGTRRRSPFPGNLVPSTRFDPVSVKVMSFYPSPTQAGNVNNYVRSPAQSINTNKYDFRLDQNFGEKTRLFGRFSQQEDVRFVPGPQPLPIGGGRSTTDTYTQAMIDATHVLSSRTVVNAQFAFSRALAAQFGLSKGFDYKQLGFPANLNAIATDQFIQGSIADIGGISNGSDSFIQYQPRNTWTSRATVSHLRGSHSMKAGVDWRILNFNEGQNTQPNGTFNFGRTFTQGPNPVQASSAGGHGFADFLLGMPNSGSIRQLMPISTQGLYYAAFFQDDWRVNSKLTLNIGVRYDINVGNREKYNRIAYFDPTAPHPLASRAGLPNLTGYLRWIGEDNERNQQSTPYTNFAPRFGFAYKISQSSVLRGGYGIFFAPRNIQGNGLGAVAAFRDTPMVASIDGGLTNANRFSNPYPSGVLPALNDRDPLTNTGATIQGPLHTTKDPYAQVFSLSYQAELPGGIVAQANYWGNKGTHLISGGWALNQLNPVYLSQGNALNGQVRNPFQGLVPAGTAISGATISLRQSLLPYPQYSGDGGVSQVFVPAGNDTYHAFTLQAEKRLSTALTFLASYTRSKAIDDVGGMINIYNRRLNKVLSAFDTPNLFIGSWVYQLPFGKGRKYAASMSAPLNTILGGWDFDGIIRLQSGQPVGVGGNNVGRSGKLDNPTIAKWFDTTAFVPTPAFTIQTTGPRSPDIRNDALQNVDAVLVKSFSIPLARREITAQFRAECFNLFNTPRFGSPNGAVTNQAFGTVTNQANTSRQFQFGLKIKF